MLPVPLQGMGGERNDGSMLTELLFPLPNQPGCLEAIHFRHLIVHEYQVVPGLRHGIDRFPAVGYDLHPAAKVVEYGTADLLVDQVVFRNQYVPLPRVAAGGLCRRDSFSCFGEGNRFIVCGPFQAHGETEDRTLARCALDADTAIHHFNELLDD